MRPRGNLRAGSNITLTGDTIGALNGAGVTIEAANAPLDAYPVGAIYLSVVSTSPATLFGGTWSAIGAGKVLVGIDSGDTDFDTVEETGGAKTVQSSAQTFAGTPSSVVVNHTHKFNGDLRGNTSGAATTNFGGITDAADASSTASNLVTGNPESGGAADYTPAGTNTPGAASSVVQPYLVVYMWKRTA